MKNITTSIFTLLFTAIGFSSAFADEPQHSKWDRFPGMWTSASGVQWGVNRVKGSGVLKQETRTVANISRLEIHLPANVALTQGSSETLSITTDDNLLPLVQTRVENGVLKISGDPKRGFSTRTDVKIVLSVKSLEAITIEGSGAVNADTLRTPALDIAIRGSGDVRFKTLRADKLTTSIEGSGDIIVDAVVAKSISSSVQGSGDVKFASLKSDQVKIAIDGSGDFGASGITDTLEIRINGSGDVRAKSLLARAVDVSINASGDAAVNVSEKLTASVIGSGDIRYLGSPKDISKNVQGSGRIRAF